MKLLGLIPARGGSKGVPRKNIKLLGGYPLIWFTFQTAKMADIFTNIILSTDDPEIAEVAKSIGYEVPFLRPDYLSTDETKSIDVVNHCLDFMSKKGTNYDAVILLQPTSPFREKGIINKALDIFVKTGSDSLVSVKKVPNQFNPHWVFQANENNFLTIATGESELISRRQDLPDAFYRDGQIYITSTEILMKRKTFIGSKLSYLLNEYEGANINIDNLNDWNAAEHYLLTNKL